MPYPQTLPPILLPNKGILACKKQYLATLNLPVSRLSNLIKLASVISAYIP